MDKRILLRNRQGMAMAVLLFMAIATGAKGQGRDTSKVGIGEKTHQIEEVTVEARYERKNVREAKRQGVPVSVIDGKTLAGRGTSIAEVLNHQTGVKMRRTGGAGSDTKINVRGLEGNRVQIYLDGYPLNTPDGSFSINDIPLQFIDRIEIYKGIVPPEFGGDGLGSAINVVTIDAQGSYYDPGTAINRMAHKDPHYSINTSSPEQKYTPLLCSAENTHSITTP